MSIEIPLFKPGCFLASGDLSSNKYLFHKIDGNGRVALSGAGENAIGVLQDKPTAINRAAEMELSGITKVIYGNTVTAGENVMSDAAGKAVPHTGTNNTTGIALVSGVSGDTGYIFLASRSNAGNSVSYGIIAIPISNALIADGDLVTDYIPGFPGTITKFSYVVTDPVTTGAKASTINLDIEATPTTGGVITLASATMTPLGAVIDGTAITAANVFAAGEKLSIVASSTTTFIEGSGLFLIAYSS